MIDRLVAGRRQPDGVTVGPGDDAAVVAMPDGRVVVSTDMLVEGRHFRLDWSAPHDVGRKAIAQNAADIESMGARTTAFVVAFGAPQDTPVAQVQELADGMWQEAGQFGAGIVGGDLVAQPAVGHLGHRAGRSGRAQPGAAQWRTTRLGGRRRRRAGPLCGRICVVAQRNRRIRGPATTPSGAATAVRPGYRRRAGRRDGDDGRLRRAAGRPRSHRDGVGRDDRPVGGRRCGPTSTRWRPRPPRPVPTRGRWCSPAARTTPWWRVSPARLPDGWRVIGAVRGRSAGRRGGRRGSGPARRVGSPSTERPEVGCPVVTTTARPLSELVEDGWAQALAPVADQVTRMGQFLRDGDRRGPALSTGGPECVACVHLSVRPRCGCSSSGRIRIRPRVTRWG